MTGKELLFYCLFFGVWGAGVLGMLLLADILSIGHPTTDVPNLAVQHAVEDCLEKGKEFDGFVKTGINTVEWRCR